MSEAGVEQSLAEENGETNGDVEHPHTSTKENEDIPSRETVLDVNSDLIAEEDADKKLIVKKVTVERFKDETQWLGHHGGEANNWVKSYAAVSRFPFEKKDEEQEGDDTSGLEEGEFEVERILDVKLKDGIIKFEVRWKGYGSEEDSWEPEENLETARLVLDDYIATNKEKVEKIKRMLDERKKRGRKNKGRRSSHAPLKEKRRGGRKSRRRSGSTVKLSESEEDDEVKEGKEETRKGTQQKKRCREQDEEVSSNVAESSGDEDFIASSRTKKADEHRVNASATRRTRLREEPLLKEPRPQNAKNAWLYDDADDGDSDDDSDHNDSAKKQKKGLEEEKSEADAPNKADKRRKRPSTVDEEIHAASKRSRKEPSAEPISKTDEKKRKCTDGKKRKREASPLAIEDDEQEDGAVSTAEDDAAENNKLVDDNIANNRRVDGAATNTEPLEVVGIVKMRDNDAAENNKSVDDNIANNRRVDGAATNTEPLEVVGIVKMRDSGVQVMCRKKDGKAYLLTVEEAVALNAMALVEYLLARTVFTSGRQ
uniref:Chromo domain-containing protein n=1 Tax=Ascaris lumbricoides TaxID=6252 RepID=A0A9J2PQH9_ASCLU